MSKKRASLREMVYKKLDIDASVLPGGILVEIKDRYAVTISGCGRIVSYTAEEIKVSVKNGVLAVYGDELVCSSYYSHSVGIEGKIRSVCFEGEE